MRFVHNSKRGFTLVEMMLALAIITIIGWTTVALMIAIKDSFMTTYNVNDSSDYAMLYANAFENSYLQHTRDNSTATIGVNPSDSILMADSTPVFTPRQMKTHNQTTNQVVDKWVVRIYFSFNTSDYAQNVKYKIFVIDNYYSPTRKVLCVTDGSVWAPHLKPGNLSLSNYANDPLGIDTDLRSDYSLSDTVWYNYIKYTATP